MTQRLLNRRVLDAPRDHLVHVMPDLVVSGCFSFATQFAHDTRRNYAHTLLFDRPLTHTDHHVITYAQANSMQVLHADRITREVIDQNAFTGAILYNVEGRSHIGEVIPSIYYSNGVFDSKVGADVVIASSKFASETNRYGQKLRADVECIIPPFAQTRGIRRIAGPPHPYTLSVISSANRDKYPGDLVIYLTQHTPDDIGMIVTAHREYKHPGVTFALDARNERCGKGLIRVPVVPTMALRYMLGADVCIFGTASSYYEPYGRTIVEAMALGKVVICERKGGPLDYLKDGVNCLLYDTPAEALEHVLRIRDDEQARKMLGANAQMWAAWHDASVHIGKLKRVLRMIGT